MTARTAGFVTRAAAGLVPPKSVSRNVDPSRGGVAVHYGGDGGPPATHAGCLARWKAWQDFHMKDRGWVDLAYSHGYCDHGWAFAGRGYGVRTAANGTDDGNDRFLAAVWIGGGTARPTQAALDALEWLIAEDRRLGAALGVRPHRSFKSTACPGDVLAAHATSLDGKPIQFTEDDVALTEEEWDRFAAILTHNNAVQAETVWSRYKPTDPATGKAVHMSLAIGGIWASAAKAAGDDVDEQALAVALAPLLLPQMVDALKGAGVTISDAQVEAAFRKVLGSVDETPGPGA